MDTFTTTLQDHSTILKYTLYLALPLLLPFLLTTLLTPRNAHPISLAGQPARTIPLASHPLPLLGHLPALLWSPSAFFQSLRNATGITTLNLAGSRHVIVSSPSLCSALLNQKSSVVDFDAVSDRILVNVFGMPKREMGVWRPALVDVVPAYRWLMTEPGLGGMVGDVGRRLREGVVGWVGFTEAVVDQGVWERGAGVVLRRDKEGEEVVEASLLPLVRDFVGNVAVPVIMGNDFVAKFPDFLDDLWTLDRGFMMMGLGLPRWVPIPSLLRAYIARKKIVDEIMQFHEAMEAVATGRDPGGDWSDLNDVSDLVKERTKAYRKHGMSMRARAGLETSLLWATNANSNALIFWMIVRILSDRELAAKVREEVEPFVKAVQPKQEFPVPELPRFDNFDIDGLCTRCPLFKSCYVECLRVDTASRSMRTVKQDFILTSRGDKEATGWLLRKGDNVHAAHDMHNTDPTAYDDPMMWHADRHIRYEEDASNPTVDLGSMRPYGGGVSMCKGRALAFKECMMFTAAIIMLWDIEPAGSGDWKIPRHKTATGVFGTKDDLRVWIKRRKLPAAE